MCVCVCVWAGRACPGGGVICVCVRLRVWPGCHSGEAPQPREEEAWGEGPVLRVDKAFGAAGGSGSRDQEGGAEAARPLGAGRPLEGRGCRPRPDRECRRGRAGGFCLRDPTGCSCWERTRGSRPWDEEAHLLDLSSGQKRVVCPGGGTGPWPEPPRRRAWGRCACSCKQAVKRDRLGCGLENLFQYSQ